MLPKNDLKRVGGGAKIVLYNVLLMSCMNFVDYCFIVFWEW